MQAFVVGLGSNLGSKLTIFEAAARLLDAREGCRVLARSPVYTSAALRSTEDAAPQPDYCNAALALRSTLAPNALLSALLEIEAELGRVRRERWGARVIDLDLLWGEAQRETPELTLPHPELERRAFALAPLLDVAPAFGSKLEEQLRARYAPALQPIAQSVRRAPRMPDDALRIEQDQEPLRSGAARFAIRASGPLEDAAALLLGGIGLLVSVELALEPPCTPLGAHVATVDAALAVTPAERLQRLVEAAVARAQNGLRFHAAVVAPGLQAARFIGGSCGAPAERARSVTLEALALESATVTGEHSAHVCATARLLFSKLGETLPDSLS